MNKLFALVAALLLFAVPLADSDSKEEPVPDIQPIQDIDPSIGNPILPDPGARNLPPVISNFNGPSSIQVGQTGTWSVTAYDPELGPLNYYVSWGDLPIDSDRPAPQPTATFTKMYYEPGTYTITLSVSDRLGATTRVTRSVNVFSTGTSHVITCELAPSTLTINAGESTWFTATCKQGGSEVECPEVVWSTTIGTLIPKNKEGPSARFIAGNSAGTGRVTLSGTDDYRRMRCYADVSVVGQSSLSCAISPSAASTTTDSSLPLVVSCFSGNAEVPCPAGMTWTATIGSVRADENDSSKAIFLSGPSAGSGNVFAYSTYGARYFVCSIPASVASKSATGAAPAGTASGGFSGGGFFRTSTSLSVACAGKPSQITVTYYASPPPKAEVNIYYRGLGAFTKVYSASVEGTSAFSFTPEKAGEYELHVSIGADQTTKSFFVGACAPNVTNATQPAVTVNLQPARQLVLSRTVSYDGGFSKEFRVYKISSQGAEDSYVTEVTLRYVHSGPDGGLKVSDSAPRQVVSSTNQIIFDKAPSGVAASPEVRFEWDVSQAEEGRVYSYGYRFSRPLTEQMIASFAPPRAIKAAEGEEGAASTDLAASLIANGLFGVSLVTIAVIVLALILLAMIIGVLFGRKKK